MSSKAEVVIIGGGVAGCSIAYHLAKKGVPSQIIERDAIASQASGKAWAVFPSPGFLLFFEGIRVPEGAIRPILSLIAEGFRRIPQMASELKEEAGLDIGYGKLPHFRLAFGENDGKRYQQKIPLFRKEGFEFGWLDGNEIKKIVPDVAPGVYGGLLFPGHQVEPYQYTLALAQAAEKRGVAIKQGEVVGFCTSGSKVNAVTLASGRVIEADVVILAMGPWVGQGTAWLGKEITIKVQREQCLRVAVSPPLPPYRLSTFESTIVPKVNGTVVVGCSLATEEAADFNDTPTEEVKEKLMTAALGLVPRLEDARIVEHRAGLEGWPPDGLKPVLGRLPGWDNVYVAARLHTMGILMSLAVGRIMADLILTGKLEKSAAHLSPERVFSNG